jgi:hypothetical protein
MFMFLRKIKYIIIIPHIDPLYEKPSAQTHTVPLQTACLSTHVDKLVVQGSPICVPSTMLKFIILLQKYS